MYIHDIIYTTHTHMQIIILKVISLPCIFGRYIFIIAIILQHSPFYCFDRTKFQTRIVVTRDPCYSFIWTLNKYNS